MELTSGRLIVLFHYLWSEELIAIDVDNHWRRGDGDGRNHHATLELAGVRLVRCGRRSLWCC